MLEIATIMPGVKQKLQSSEAKGFENSFYPFDVEHLDIVQPLNGIYYIDNVLSTKECENLRFTIDDCEAMSFWNEKGRDLSLMRYRNADTVEVESEVIAKVIWDRVKHLLSSFCTVKVLNDETDPNYERELIGDWLSSGLNHDILFAKYPPLGSFSPHTDGRAIYDFNLRSFFSVIIFLSSIPIEFGGGTRFYSKEATKHLTLINTGDTEYWTADKSYVTTEVESVAGRMLIFHQALVHEGLPTKLPYQKYILRSDVLLQRFPKICNDDNDILAYEIYREGEALSEQGKIEEGIKLFSKAFKISPKMAVIMGQC
jgi:leukotriene-A4 hydrolase